MHTYHSKSVILVPARSHWPYHLEFHFIFGIVLADLPYGFLLYSLRTADDSYTTECTCFHTLFIELWHLIFLKLVESNGLPDFILCVS